MTPAQLLFEGSFADRKELVVTPLGDYFLNIKYQNIIIIWYIYYASSSKYKIKATTAASFAIETFLDI